VHLDRIKIIFIVKDTGIGITNENMGNLFNDYVRIQQKNDKYIEGTGLGLSIVRNFCKMMGGSVYVESEYGKGSTFTATIMQQISDDSSLILDTDIISQKSELDTFNVKFTVPNWKMLVVDDNLTNLMVAKGYIEPYEIQITTVQTGDEALKLAKNQYFDIFLIDHMMPGMDGITLMKYLRDLEKITQPMVIIAFTANAIVGVKEMLLQEGFDDYLSKPIDSQKLAAIIEKYSPQDLRIQIKNSETIMNLPNKDTLDEININGIDSIIGLKRCNSNKKIYKRALQIFLDEAIETNKKLLNLENYGITEIKNIYHSIKSAAANIGAVSVSDLAANLENKCNQGTFSHTDHIISDFQTQFSNIINNIQDYYNLSAISGECKAESDNNLDKNLIFDLLDKLSVAISSNDFGSIDNIIETIESHNTGKLTSNINKIEQFILTAEFENALDIISSIKSEG
jgi:CheY-like chemotaxis protein